jgi:two-component system, NtrC family, sensor kinase
VIPSSNILVVDDEPGMRDLLGFELGRRGHRITYACDGLEAIARLERNEFDTVITDARMPGADGLSVIKAAKESCPETEVVVVTAYADVDFAVKCLRSGASDLVRKPFDLSDLLSSVDRVLDHRRLRTIARLHEACRNVFVDADGTRLPERIARAAIELLGADDVSLMLTDATGALRIVFSTGVPTEHRATTRLALGERVAGRVAQDGIPAILPSPDGDDDRFDGVETACKVRSAIVVPLLSHEGVLGVLTINRVQTRRMFRKADLETAGILAAHAALAIANERLAQSLVGTEKLASVGQLAAGIVHEINNPLTYVSSNADYVRGVLSDAARDPDGSVRLSRRDLEALDAALDDVALGARRIEGIIADMRRLSRVGDDVHEMFDVNDAIRSAIRIGGACRRGAVDLVTDLGEDVEVQGNAGRLSQVLVNLIVNAIQAVEDAGRNEGRVRVRSRRQADRVIVEVIDNGPGISAENLCRIMEPFFTTKPTGRGTGLGLAISRQIAEEHGGALEAESQAGRGATFRLVLPA